MTKPGEQCHIECCLMSELYQTEASSSRTKLFLKIVHRKVVVGLGNQVVLSYQK